MTDNNMEKKNLKRNTESQLNTDQNITIETNYINIKSERT